METKFEIPNGLSIFCAVQKLINWKFMAIIIVPGSKDLSIVPTKTAFSSAIFIAINISLAYINDNTGKIDMTPL